MKQILTVVLLLIILYMNTSCNQPQYSTSSPDVTVACGTTESNAVHSTEIISAPAFATGYITSDRTIIESNHFIFNIDANVYVISDLTTHAEILYDALETVSGLKFDNVSPYGDGKITVYVVKGTDTERELGAAGACRGAKTIMLSPGSLFVSNSYAIVHELAHVLQTSQSGWAYCTMLSEGFAQYTCYEALQYLEINYPSTAYLLDFSEHCLNDMTMQMGKYNTLHYLYQFPIEHWFENVFTYTYNKNYTIGFRLMSYLASTYGNYASWISNYEGINSYVDQPQPCNRQVFSEVAIANMKTVYGDSVLDDFYPWLQANESMFQDTSGQEHYVILASHINLYPSFNAVGNYVTLTNYSVEYNDLYINLESAAYYLKDYKNQNIDDVYLANPSNVIVKLYNANGRLLAVTTESKIVLQSVSFIQLVGQGTIKGLGIKGFYTNNS